MDKTIISAFSTLYDNVSYPVLLCDDNFTVIKANKDAERSILMNIDNRQLTKLFISPNKFLAVKKLKECEIFNGIIKLNNNSLYSVNITKNGGYNNGCIITFGPYTKLDNDKKDKFIFDENIISSVLDNTKASMLEIYSNLLGIKTRYFKTGQPVSIDYVCILSKAVHSILLNLLNISVYFRYTSKTLNSDDKRIHLNQYLNQLFERYSDDLSTQHLKLEFSITMEDIISNVDPNFIILLIDNLLTNAINNHPHGTKIKAKLTKSEDNFCISIQNKGSLIPKPIVARAFDPYYKYDPDSKNINGIGLGLTVSKIISELYGGNCKFSSTTKYGNVSLVTIPIINSKNNEIERVSESLDVYQGILEVIFYDKDFII